MIRFLSLFCLCIAAISWANEWELTPRAGVLYTSSHPIKDVYGSRMPFYQLELNRKLDDHWRLFYGIGYVSKKGHSEGYNDYKTHLRLIPLELGFTYSVPLFWRLHAYLGGGAAYTFLRIHDHSPYVQEHIKKGSFGGVAKAGLYTQFCNGARIELFSDYMYNHFHFSDDGCTERNNLTLSNYFLGLGASIPF